MKADCRHRFLLVVSLCALLSGCAYPVKISGASIHPAFNQPFTTWAGQRVRVVLTPSLRAESLKLFGASKARISSEHDQSFGEGVGR
jgi:hypothetical protein